MLAARRGVGAVPATISCLWTSRRHLHRHRSPDRTFSQRIQDQQNTFRWESRHVFRPHQHFSYDPSNWSRTLEEKSKKQFKLSLVERVKQMQEREAERSANATAILRESGTVSESMTDSLLPTSGDDVPTYFFAAEDVSSTATQRASSEKAGTPLNSWDEVSLQELVEEVVRLRHLLFTRRYAGNASLARRRHQEEEFRVVLFQLFDRLSGATLGTTVTVDACAFGWFTLLQHIEPLVDIVAHTAQLDNAAPQDAVQKVFSELQRGLLHPMAETGVVYVAAAGGELSLEALIELLSVAACPFVRNCGDAFQGGTVSESTLVKYAGWVADAARERACDVGEDAGEDAHLREWMDPWHVEAWTAAARHLHRRGGATAAAVESFLPGLVQQVEHAALYLTRTLESVTGTTLRGRVKESLRRTAAPPAHSGDAEEAERVIEPKAVVLDATAPPRGVQPAPTACDDVVHVLSAATAVAQLVSERSGGATWRRLVQRCLLMTAHTPNYDLEGVVVVRWACALLQTGALLPSGVDEEVETRTPPRRALAEGSEDSVRQSLRFLLLLSRLSFVDVVDRPALGRLVLLLTQYPMPECNVPADRAEWCRLRGFVMRAALDRLTCADLVEASAGVDGVSTWVEALAFGEYDGVVPAQLWRTACEQWLPLPQNVKASPSGVPASTKSSACTPSVAHALLVLCARYLAREDAGRSAGVANLHSLHTVECVAACVAAFRGSPELSDALLSSADAWDAICVDMPDGLQRLFAAMQAVVQSETAQTKVMTF